MAHKELTDEYRKWWRGLKPSEKQRLIDSKCFDASEPEFGDPLDSRALVNDTPISMQPGTVVTRESKHNNIVKLFGIDDSAFENLAAKEEKKPKTYQLTEADMETISQRLNSVLIFLVKSMDDSTDPSTRLDAEVVRIVLGMYDAPKQIDLAEKYNVTRATVSWRCTNLLRRLGLENSVYMRPQNAVLSMRISRILTVLEAGSPPARNLFEKALKRRTRPRLRKIFTQKPSLIKGKRKNFGQKS